MSQTNTREGWAPTMPGEWVNHYIRNGEALCGATSVAGYHGRLFPHTGQVNKCDCRTCAARMQQLTLDLHAADRAA